MFTYSILQAHNTSGDAENLKIKFDAMASHDITFVGIIQTARASGLEKFPIPYVLTNCHNSLCAVGGTINEDDHRFGLSAAKKYGRAHSGLALGILDHVAVSKEVPLKSSSHTNSHLDESPEETHEISPPKNKADHINTNTFLINTSFKLNHKGNTNNHKTQLKGKTIQ